MTKRIALVTGGMGGLGESISTKMHDAGYRVVVTHSPGNKTAEQWVADYKAKGYEFSAYGCDVADYDSCVACAAAVSKDVGPIDILVNNAGIIRRADAVDFTEADWDAVMDVNLKSVFFLSQAVVRRLITDARGGKIINTASMLSFQGGIRVPSYTASKSGVAGLTKLMANEWARHGINANAIAPGYFATDNTQALQDDPVRSKEILGRIPAGRWGQPSDIGGAAVFLASSASDYVQGITLPVDGGWLAR